MPDTPSSPPDPSLQDAGTGLPNRRALIADLRLRIPQGQGALVFLDIDDWKKTCQPLRRDQIGRLLAKISERLRSKAPEPSPLYRYAGGSFCLLIPEADRDRAAEVAEALRAVVAQDPFIVLGGSEKEPSVIVSLTLTAAAAAYPQDGRSPATLLETAELAVLSARHAGPNSVSVVGRLDPAVLAQIGVYRGLPCPILIGRAAEQSRLRQMARDIRHVGPTFTVVAGSAGIGKSRLVKEVCQWARAERFVTLSGTCQESRSSLPYAALAELVEALLLTDRELLLKAVEGLSPAHRAALLVVIRDLPSPDHPENIPLSEYGRLIFEAFGAMLDEFAKIGPLVISLDEAEYADPATLAVLEAAMIRRLPMLVLMATNQDPDAFRRTAAGDFHASRATNASRILIPPLSVEEVEKLLQAVLPDADIAREVSEGLVARAAGNPLYLEETVRWLLLRGKARRVQGRWSISSLERGELPADLNAAIRSVVEAIPVSSNSLLTRAAVIGNQIDSDLLQDVLGHDETEMLDLLDEARRFRLLVASDQGADRLIFPAEHARRLRLMATPSKEKQEIHGRVGIVQEARHGGDAAHLADELAFHYSRAGNEERARHFDTIARRRAAILHPPRTQGIRRARVDPIKTPLSPEATNRALAVMRHFHGALKVGRLYPQWSQVSTAFLKQLRDELDALLAAAPGLTITNSPSGPLINGQPSSHPAAIEFAALLDDRLVESVTILASFERSGLDGVIQGFMAPVDRGRVDPDLWDRFLARDGLQGIDIVQKAFQARDQRTIRLEVQAEEPVPPEVLPSVRDMLRSLKAAVDNLRLYPPGHALVEETAEDASRELLSLVSRVPSVTLGTAEGELVLNGRPADLKFLGEGGVFIRREIDLRKLDSVTMRKGLEKDEVISLIGFLATPLEDLAGAGQRIRSYFRHIGFGSHQYERAREDTGVTAMGPPPKPIRSELRALEFLSRPYSEFLSSDLQEQFANLVEVLSYGTRKPLAEELVSRLGGHFHDPELPHRQQAFRMLIRSLTFASPSARQVGVAQTASPLRRRLLEDAAPDAFRLAAGVLTVWVPAAATAGCLRELAEIAGPVLRRRAKAPETPPAIAADCDKALQLIPDTGAYAVLFAAAEKPRAEDRLPAISILLAIGGRAVERLVEVLVTEPDVNVRKNIALAIGLAAEELTAPLTRALTADTPLQRLSRALAVAEPLLTPAMISHFGEIAEKARPEVRREVIRATEHWPAGATYPILRRLILSPTEACRLEGIDAATRLKLGQAASDVGRLLEGTQDEALIRACSRYFAAVPNSTVVPVLTRVVKKRPRWFGLVKGYSEETRGEAAKALALQAPQTGEPLLSGTNEGLSSDSGKS